MKTDNAFNPHKSFVITASAGSGKTHQLVNRYLHLAFTLADRRLSRILTVTFTRKAAAEMQQRIIEEAARLLSEESSRRELEAALGTWFRGKAGVAIRETANHILRNSQSMRAVTMDSLFSWLSSRFSVEAGLPVPSEVATASRQAELTRAAWFRLLNCDDCRRALHRAASILEGDLNAVLSFVEGLYRGFRPTLYLHYRGDREAMREDLTLEEGEPYSRKMLERDLWVWIESLLADFPRNTPARSKLFAEISEFLATKDLERLLSSALFKPAAARWFEENPCLPLFTVNRGKLPAELKERAEDADEYLARFCLSLKVRLYNRLVENLFVLHGYYEKIIKEVKRESALVDFADISIGAFRLLQNPGIAFTLQSGIQHLLIDEFQDTSRLQWEIFRPVAEELLSGQGVFGTQSFFAVGDLKQSIYGFREADYTLLEEVAARAAGSEGLELLTLHRSFRSSPLIIEFVNAVFEGAGLPDFRPHETAVPEVGGSVTVYPLISKEEGGGRKGDRWRKDAVRIAESISQFVEKQVPVADRVRCGGEIEYRRRPAAYGDIAVLYRKKDASVILESELARKGVPCRREEEGGFYRRREVQDILALLDFLSDPENGLALSTVLRSPLIGLPEKEFAAFLEGVGPGSSLWSAFRKANAGRRTVALEAALHGVGREPVARIVETFLQSTDARLRYQIAFGDELPAANLDTVIDLLAGLSARGVNSIRECRNTLLRMSEEDETRVAGEAGDCVRLMTVHKAKGLEFKALYLFDASFSLPEAGRSNTFVLLRHRRAGTPPLMYFPPVSCRPDGHSNYDSWREQAGREAEAEELRVFYVALTRASQHLFISGVDPGSDAPPFYERVVEAARRLAEGGDWQTTTTDHAGQEVLIRLAGPNILKLLGEAVPREPEKVDERIFKPDKSARGAVFIRPSAAGEEDTEGVFREGDIGLPDKYRVLGLAIHRAMECRTAGKTFSIKKFLDGFMEKSHPHRAWVEEELEKDMKRMEKAKMPARLEGAELKTEVPVLDLLSPPQAPARIVTGVIDLLAVFHDRVEFYDYKSRRVAEGKEREAATRYHSQMGLYAKTLSDIYSLPVTGYLVFTATGKIIKMQ